MIDPFRARACHLRVAALVMGGAILVAGCVAGRTGGPPSPSVAENTVPATSSAPVSVPGGSSGASPMMPGPSGPLASALESMAPGPTSVPAGPPAASGGGGHKGNDLIECVGLQGGPPCVSASDALFVIAAVKALPSADAAAVANAVFVPLSGSCPPTGAVAACSGTNTGVGTVTFALKDGSHVRVFVYREASGSIAGYLLG